MSAHSSSGRAAGGAATTNTVSSAKSQRGGEATVNTTPSAAGPLASPSAAKINARQQQQQPVQPNKIGGGYENRKGRDEWKNKFCQFYQLKL
jgi:hypothetical protein